MKRALAWVADHPVWTLLGVTALTVAALAGLFDLRSGRLRLEVDPSTSGLVAPGDEAQVFHDRVRRLFGSEDGVVVLLDFGDVFTPDSLARVAQLSERLAALDGVSRVLSLTTATHVRAVDGDVEIGPFFEQVPTEPAQLARLRDEVFGNPLYAGSLVSRDGGATAILVYFGRLSDRAYLESGLDERIVALAEQEAGAAAVHVTGRVHVLAATSDAVLSELAKVLPLIFVFVGLVLLLAFRNARGVLVPLTTISLALLWTLGVVAWLDRPLNLVTTIVPPLVITVGFAYAMHMVSEYFECVSEREDETSRAELVRNVLAGVSLPLLLTGLTTALGFFALLATPMPAIREFGALSVLGVVCALLASFSFAPATLRLLPVAQPKVSQSRSSRLSLLAERVAHFDHRNRRAVLLVGGAVFGAAVAGMTQIHVGADHIGDFDPDARVRRDYEAINAKLEGGNPFQVVVEAQGRDAFTEPANLRALRELQDWLEAQPEIGVTTSVVDYLMLLNRALHDEDPAYFAIPESERLAKQLLFFGASEELDRLVDSRYTSAAISLRARVNDSRSTSALLERIQARLARLPEHLRAQATGEIVVLNGTLDAIARGQLQSLGLAVLTIYFVLAAMFTSFRVGLLALFPNVLPIAIFFGVLGYSGVALSASTSLIACIALGIAVDDSIHYLARFNMEVRRTADERSAVVKALRAVAQPVTFTTLGLCLGFLALTTSELRGQVQFGMLAALTLGAAWVCDVTVTPALCSHLRVATLWDVLSLDLGKDPQRSIPLLEGLSLRQARIVALMLSLVEVPSGTRLFREGEEGREMYVVIDGKLRGSVDRGGSVIELATMGRGDAVGEIALFAGRRTADVSTVSDARLLRITPHELEQLRRRYPRIAARLFQNLNRILAERLVRTTKKVG